LVDAHLPSDEEFEIDQSGSGLIHDFGDCDAENLVVIGDPYQMPRDPRKPGISGNAWSS
jgi:hypothetical protein